MKVKMFTIPSLIRSFAIPEVPGLCDYVIIDHQWLFDRLQYNLYAKQSSDKAAKLSYSIMEFLLKK